MCFYLGRKTEGTLKFKRRTLIITSCEVSSNSIENLEEDGQSSYHPVTVREADDLEVDTKLAETPEILKNVEDFQHGPANGKFMKRHFL